MNQIKVTDHTGTLLLDADAKPSIDDKNSIIRGVVHQGSDSWALRCFDPYEEEELRRERDDHVFGKLVEAAFTFQGEFEGELTNEEFQEACEEWVAGQKIEGILFRD